MTVQGQLDQSQHAGGDPETNPSRTGNPALAFYRRRSSSVHTVLTVLLGAAIWQILAGRVSPLVIVPLQDIWAEFLSSLRSGELWTDFAASSQGFLIGFLLAAAAGVVIGVAMATSRIIFDFLDPWVSALYSTPLIALAPLFIVVFGIGLTAKVAVVVTLSIFPVIINTTSGIRATDHSLIECAHAFGASQFQIFTKILIPAAVPFIVTGLRLAVGRALIGVVVAEFFGSRAGLGHMVFAASQSFNTAGVWLGVFVLAAIGMTLIRLMYRFEKWVAPWRDFRMP